MKQSTFLINDNDVVVKIFSFHPDKCNLTDTSSAYETEKSCISVSFVCQALLAIISCPGNYPVIISTEENAPKESDFLKSFPNEAEAELITDTQGWLFFPESRWFVGCAQNALKTRNPSSGLLSLSEVWQQAILLGLVH